MNRSTLGATVFLCAFFSGISSGAQETRSLKTADTEVRFENAAGGPHLLDLKTNDGQVTQDQIVTDSANNTLSEIDFRRDKEALVFQQSGM